jgi:hypothetical protein
MESLKKWQDWRNLNLHEKINFKSRNLFSFDNPYNKCYKPFDIKRFISRNNRNIFYGYLRENLAYIKYLKHIKKLGY